MPSAEEMTTVSLRIGDWVRVVNDEYTFTVKDSIGVVVGAVGYQHVAVEFKEIGPTGRGDQDCQEFDIRIEDLEKIDPPAHLVGRGPFVIPPQETAPKTREEKIEIFSRKIDSEEVFKACVEEAGVVLLGSSWWMTRDDARENLGYFKSISLPRVTGVLQDNYLHLSKCKTKVAFAENEDKQKRDIWTVMGYGRYLTKYHPELDNEQVKKAVDAFNYDYGPAPEVFFGETQDEFIRAINEGPSESCMSRYASANGGNKTWFKGHIHPAAAYASGDIKVAWLEREGKITARTLINKGTKAFSRVYGDQAKLKPLLESMGYESRVGALAGCRLLMIDNENGDGYIMPYVDAGTGSGGGSLNFAEGDGFFVLNDEGYGVYTKLGYDNGGVTESQGYDYHCDDCGCGCDEDELTYTYHETSVCESCLRDGYTFALVGSDRHEYVRDRDTTYVHCMSEDVHDDYLSELDVVMDDFSNKYIDLDDAVQTLSERWTSVSDCVRCGENEDGDTIWLHESEVRDALIGELYMFKGDKSDLFWHESVEVQAWLESAGDEDHDPDEFVLVEAKTVEEKAEVKPAPEPQKTWQAVYLRMQERGIKFTHLDYYCGPRAFDDGQHVYKIDPTQTPPDDWREIYREAQASGVWFEHGGDDYGGNWYCRPLVFSSPFSQYRLKETT